LADLVQCQRRHSQHPNAAGIRHGDGWFDLLWRLCVDLEPLVREFERQAGKSFEVLTVKQKFGSLRFRPIGGSDLIWTRIAAAQEESA